MSNELTQQVIDEIRAKRAKAANRDWDKIRAVSVQISGDTVVTVGENNIAKENSDYVVTLHNNAEALLTYASYGLKAKEFFREMENKLADQRVTVICNDYCPIDLAKALGLLPKEGE